MYSRQWRYFPDFLLDNMKNVLGRDWGQSASKSMPDHPLFRWLRRLKQARDEASPGDAIPARGYISAVNRFCYALYLIEHNDKAPKSLVSRLRMPNEFGPASYEALVASAFAVAGAGIDGAEDERGNKPKPEFYATFRSGTRYAVEAKRKNNWNAPFNVDDEAFITELRKWLKGKLHAAAKKELLNPVYWFELNIGQELSKHDAERLRHLISDAVENAESITVKGNPAQPAYVVVTNNADFANDDATGLAYFALFMGFRMEDFREGILDLETAMQFHDKHRDIRRVLECMEEVQQVPVSFDGLPDELLDEHGRPFPTMKIGDSLVYTREDGTEGVGRITEITASGDKAHAAIYEASTDKAYIITIPLTELEAKAAAKLGDAIFGKPAGPQQNITDPLGIYDRMLEIHGNYGRESLLRQLTSHPQFLEFQDLSLEALRVRVAREITKIVVAHSEERARTNAARG